MSDPRDACRAKCCGNCSVCHHGLLEITIKDNTPSMVLAIDALNVFLQSKAQWLAWPSKLIRIGYGILRPAVFGLILFGGTIKDFGAAEDYYTRLGIDIFIECGQQSGISQRGGDQLAKPWPQPLP
jgi:hypothetical protein